MYAVKIVLSQSVFPEADLLAKALSVHVIGKNVPVALYSISDTRRCQGLQKPAMSNKDRAACIKGKYGDVVKTQKTVLLSAGLKAFVQGRGIPASTTHFLHIFIELIHQGCHRQACSIFIGSGQTNT